MRYLMTFSYDGTNFYGYQKQINKRTVQSEIEKSLKKITKSKIDIYASGRTDSKVHALNQKAHFDYEGKMTEHNFKKALNSILPSDIYVKKVELVSKDFHARFNVKYKEYIYKINTGEYNPLEKNYVYQYNKELDIKKMKTALNYLEGTHNFKSFTKANDLKNDYVRTIIKTTIIQKNSILTISFLGTGFMRYQVRNMVGLLLEIGSGKRNSNDVINIIDYEDRRKSGITAPPEGLYLKDVFYK